MRGLMRPQKAPIYKNPQGIIEPPIKMNKFIPTLIALLFAGACATALKDRVVGEYELKNEKDSYRQVYLKNGLREYYINGTKGREYEGEWKIGKDGKIHINKEGLIAIYRINKNDSISLVAEIDKDDNRTDLPEDKQVTLDKIKQTPPKK